MKSARATHLVVVAVLLLAEALALAGCGSSTTAQTTGVNAMATTTTTAIASTTTSAIATSPFTQDDLHGLVLPESEGNGLVEGLLYSPRFSGTATLLNVRHWTLVPPERLEAAGFAKGFVSIFFTDAFYSTDGKSGRSLVTAALLFATPDGATQAAKVFADSGKEFWKDLQSLSPVPGANGIGMTGRLGTDNTPDFYPCLTFGMQVANLYLIVGSEGGAQSDQPLPENVMRSLAEKLLRRAQDRLAQIRAGG